MLRSLWILDKSDFNDLNSENKVETKESSLCKVNQVKNGVNDSIKGDGMLNILSTIIERSWAICLSPAFGNWYVKTYSNSFVELEPPSY